MTVVETMKSKFMSQIPKVFPFPNKQLVLNGVMLLFCLSVLSMNISAATVYEGEGRRFIRKSSELAEDSPFSFKVRVYDDCRWVIETFPLKAAGTNSLSIRYVDWCDGVNSVSSMITTSNGVDIAVADVVDLGVKPPTGNPWASGLWLALCSECYFKTNRQAIAPIWDVAPEVRAKGQMLDATISFSSPNGGLPVKLVARNPGYFWRLDGAKNLVKQVYAKPYDQGFRKVDFAVQI
jgi:hypothetical protein